MLDASTGLEEVAACPADGSVDREKWARGLPALRNEAIAIPPGLKDILLPLCTALAEGGAGDSALHIRDAIAANGIDADSLLSVSLAQKSEGHSNQRAAHGLLARSGVADRRARQRSAGASSVVDRRSSIVDRRWTIDDGRSLGPRLLSRSAGPGRRSSKRTTAHTRCAARICALGWSLHSHRCVYCGNAGEDFVAAAPDVNRPRAPRRAVREVQRLHKSDRRRSEPTPFPLLAIDDLATMHLDRGRDEPRLSAAGAVRSRRDRAANRVLGPAKPDTAQ